MNINRLASEKPKNKLVYINIQFVFTLFLSTLTVLFLPQNLLAAEDTEPPNLTSVNVSPTAIDVTSDSATVTMTASITDNLSGVTSGRLDFRSPTTNVYRRAYFGAGNRISGDALEGTYEATVSFPQFSEAGDWKLVSAYVTDVTTNNHYYNEADLILLGFNTTIAVTSTPDTTGPVLSALNLSPVSVDASGGPASFTMNATVSDDLSGFNYAYLYLYSPISNQSRNIPIYSSNLLTGDALAGTYQSTSSLPQYSESGDWQIRYGTLYDKAGNYKSLNEAELSTFNAILAVTSSPEDITGPALEGFSISPVVNTILGPDTALFSSQISDNLSGFTYANGRVVSPSGGQSHYFSWSSYYRTEGDALNGKYEYSKEFPQYSEYGEWKINYVNLSDNTTNRTYHNTAALELLGLPTTLLIEGVISDGSGNYTVGSAGGTINTDDEILTVEIPEGALTEDTVISITRAGRFEPVDIYLSTGPGKGNVIAEYKFEPDGLTFDVPVTVTMTIDVTDYSQNKRDRLDVYLYIDTDADGIEDTFDPLPDAQIISVDTITNPDDSVDMVFVFQLEHFSTYAVIEEIVNDTTDTTPPNVEITVPAEDSTLQGSVKLSATVTDDSSIQSTDFTIREANEADGVMIGYENVSATQVPSTDIWELASFDTSQILDGYYVIFATAVDEFNNEGISEIVSFTIRNWSLTELLPATKKNRAGRTMPVKFSMRLDYETDPSMPFVHNEELEIRIYEISSGDNILMQTSRFGEHSTDYRIDNIKEHYITNFKTSKTPGQYLVEVWRMNIGSGDFLIDQFTFETNRK